MDDTALLLAKEAKMVLDKVIASEMSQDHKKGWVEGFFSYRNLIERLLNTDQNKGKLLN